MKKVLIIVGILLIGLLAFFFFFGNGKETISNFFNENNDFGSFFDIDPKSDNDFVNPPEVFPPTDTGTTGPYAAPVLRQISFEPVAGYTFYATTSTSTRTTVDPERGEQVVTFTSTSTAVRFQERATGHVYDVFEFLEAPIKASNSTMQKIYTALFTNDKNDFVAMTTGLSSEQVRSTFVRIIPEKPETAKASSTPQTVETKDFSSVVNDFAFIPQTNKLAYSVKQGNSSAVYTSDPARTTETLVATLPFNEFTIDSINATQVLIQTKASITSLGYAYALTLSNGSMTKIIGDLPGLLIKASSDLKYYIYSESTLSLPVIRGFNTDTDSFFRIGFYTIPEKCVFSTKSTNIAYCFGATAYRPAIYPDDWYKGKVFNDEDLYKVDFSTGAVETVYIFDDTKSFDAIQPKLSAGDGHIAFMNKYDLTLWAIDLDALNNQLN